MAHRAMRGYGADPPTGINPHLGGCQPWQKRGGRAPAPMATDAVADLSDRPDRAAREAGHER